MIEKNLEKKIFNFKNQFDVDEKVKDRIICPKFSYIGEEIWKEAISAILAGKNILLVGDKSTGKNVLAENLAFCFNRPLRNISFHVNIDAYSLIGGDSLKNGDIFFRPGPIYKVAKFGGFGILDEINMAKNEAIAVLHQVLDYRRTIDVPEFGKIDLHPASRFIATMNYDYEGTRELNQALLSRFVIIQMPLIKYDDLIKLIKIHYKNMKQSYMEQFALLFFDINKKYQAGEIESTSGDIRSLFDSFDLIKENLSVTNALKLTLTNKSFDPFEKELIDDLIKSRFKENTYYKDVFINWYGWF